MYKWLEKNEKKYIDTYGDMANAWLMQAVETRRLFKCTLLLLRKNEKKYYWSGWSRCGVIAIQTHALAPGSICNWNCKPETGAVRLIVTKSFTSVSTNRRFVDQKKIGLGYADRITPSLRMASKAIPALDDFEVPRLMTRATSTTTLKSLYSKVL